jgi:hypothetical protein
MTFNLTRPSRWSPKPLLHAHHRSALFDSCILELKTWYYDLPSELKIERPSGPSRFAHTYTLYMVYHTTFLLLCGPFLSGNPPPKNEEPNKSSEQHETSPENLTSQKALTACCASIRSMISVAQKYRQTFGSFKLSPVTATYCTLSAALIIIEKCCSLENYGKPSPPEESVRTLSPHAAAGLFFQVLRELSTSWNIAKRIGRNLEKVYCDRFGQHIPSPPSDYCPPPCPIATQPMDSNQALVSGIIPMQAFDAFFDPKSLTIEDPIPRRPEDQIPVYAENVLGQQFGPTFDGVNMDLLQNLPNSAELFASGHGFAFSPDCLPSDYNMFDTLNQMYLEETW